MKKRKSPNVMLNKQAWQPFISYFHSLSARTWRGAERFRKPASVSMRAFSPEEGLNGEGRGELRAGRGAF